jgi:hypothetical protein
MQGEALFLDQRMFCALPSVPAVAFRCPACVVWLWGSTSKLHHTTNCNHAGCMGRFVNTARKRRHSESTFFSFLDFHHGKWMDQNDGVWDRKQYACARGAIAKIAPKKERERVVAET